LAKVVILGSAWPLRGGGLATFNERLARAFMADSHQVILYTFSLQYPSILFPGKTQLSDEAAPVDLQIKVKVNSINPLNWFRVGKELKKLRPDIIVIRYWLPFMAPCLGTIASIAKKNNHTSVIAIADNIVPHEKRPADKWLTSFFVNRMDGFITMSRKVTADLLNTGVTEDKISFCNHPLYDNFGETITRAEARKNLGIDDNLPLILFFGFIREYKGLDILLQAMAEKGLEKHGVKLLVAGEFYSSSEKFYKIAEESGVNHMIIWHTDFIPNDKVRDYFCAADLVAQPYKDATQSGVTQIAYHFEIPMLVTNVGGLAETVPHGKAGYVVEPKPEEIGKALLDYFDNKSAEKLKEGLRHEKQRFSWSALVEAIFDLAGKNTI
jgi:D-inositol-3-phosphate glycosyltransferase